MADGPRTPEELDHDPINKTLNSLTEVEDQMDADQLDPATNGRRREDGPDDDDRRYSEDDHDRARDLSRGGDQKYYRNVSMDREHSQDRRLRSHSPHTPPLPGSTSNDPSSTTYDRRGSATGRGRTRSPVERRDRDRSLSRSPRMRDRERDKERDSDRRSRSRSRERPRIFVPRYVPGVSASSGGPPGLGRQSHRDCRVYVGNLPYEVKWHHLKDFMREAGDVIFADILVQQNGMSKGCGVVEYRTPEDAQRAIRKLNDTLFMGRPVFIREDRESEAKFGGVGANRPVSGRQVYVGNLPYAVGWQELKDMFRSAGSVVRADVLLDHARRSKGSGTVLFETSQEAMNAISMYDGYEWNGRRIEVREDRYAGMSGPSLGPSPRPSLGARGAGWSSSGRGPTPGGFGGHSSFGAASGHGGAGQFGGSGSGPSGGAGADYSHSYYRAAGGGVGGAGGVGGTGGTGGSYGYGLVGGSGDGVGGGGEVAGRADEGVGDDPDSYHHGGGYVIGRPGMMDYSGSGYGAGGYGSGQYGQQASGYDSTQASGYGYNGPVAQASGPGEVAGSQIFVNNLPFTTTWQDLIDLFRSCGNIIRSEVLEQNGRPKGSGVVRFDSYDAAERAVTKFNGYLYGGRNLDVHFDRYAT